MAAGSEKSAAGMEKDEQNGMSPEGGVVKPSQFRPKTSWMSSLSGLRWSAAADLPALPGSLLMLCCLKDELL